MVAAFLAREHLEGLARRAHGLEALPSGGQRGPAAALAVQEEERAADFLGHAVEPKALELLQRLLLRLDAEDPQQLLPGHRERGILTTRDPVQAILPDGVVIPLGAPRDTGGQPRLEGGG